MSSIKSDDEKIVYFIKESVCNEEKVKLVIEKLITNNIKNSLITGGEI